MRFRGALRRYPQWLILPLLLLAAIPLAVLGGIFLIAVTFCGLVRGAWFRLFPPPAVRDVSRLSNDLNAVVEMVADAGQPLKEHHRRKIVRDSRLLPKPRPPQNVWPRPKRKRLMTADEATRLFTATLRSTDRRTNDLLADEEQLRRLQLPLWKTEAELAAALGIAVKTLRHYSIHREQERVCHYVCFEIPKRDGRFRLIMAPKQRLKAILRQLNALLVDRLTVSEQAHGFRPGRSVRTGAEAHVGKAVLLKLDLKDFFPSVTFARVRGLLIASGYGYSVAAALAVLMTEAERQPVEIDGELFHVPVGPRHCVQGAPTSPGLCNAICTRLDRRLAGLAAKYDWSYTRYADDLAFSGNAMSALKPLRDLACVICREEGFAINTTKTRICRKGSRQRVTGVTVNDVAGLSRRERRLLRAVVHRQKQNNPAQPATLTPGQLRGKLAYLHMLNPEQARQLTSRLA